MANTYFLNSVLVISSIFVAAVQCENSTNVSNVSVFMATSYEINTTQLLSTTKAFLQSQSTAQHSTNARENTLTTSQQINSSPSQNFIASSSQHPLETMSSIRPPPLTTASRATKEMRSSKTSDISFSTLHSQTALQQTFSIPSHSENTMSLSTAFENNKSKSTIYTKLTSISSLSFSTKISTTFVSTMASSVFPSSIKKMTSSFIPLSSDGKNVVKTSVLLAANSTAVVSSKKMTSSFIPLSSVGKNVVKTSVTLAANSTVVVTSSRYKVQINQTSTRHISTAVESTMTLSSFWVKSSLNTFTPISKVGVSSSYSASPNTFSSKRNEKETQSVILTLSKALAFSSKVVHATTSVHKQFATSSKHFQLQSTAIQPSPTGSTRIPQVASSNAIPSYNYKYTVTMEVEGNCTLLDDDTVKNEFFKTIRANLEKEFGVSGGVFVDNDYECGSVIFNYTVNSPLNPSKFRENLEKKTNETFDVNGISFMRVKENIAAIEYPKFSSSAIVTQTPTSTKSPDNKKNLTVLYATIFSVVGFVVVVIIIVIIIGCRKNGNVMGSRRSYELGRFDHTSVSKAAVNMYGAEPIIKDATDSESKPDEDLSPKWDIPKLEIDDEKSALNASKATGVENKALHNDEE